MENMKMKIRNILYISTALMAFGACDRYEGDVVKPSYLKIDAITVADNPSASWSPEGGFFSSDVDGVNVVFWVEGDTAETNLGMYTLPCRIPVLRNGNITRITISPVVKQDGIAGKRIFYPYYEELVLNDITLQTDSVTDLGTLQTHYVSHSLMKVLWQDFFEPGPGNVTLDTVVGRCYAMDTVLSGYGCGVVRVPADKTVLNFWSDTTFHIDDPTKIVYLEMDYWSDFDFSVGFNNPVTQDGSNVISSHMTIYGKPEMGWQKIYINIGATWSRTYSHYPYIRPYFTIFNNSGHEGNLFIDNLKLITL